MDNLRGTFDSRDVADDGHDWDAHEEENARDLPPEAIGQDERRMQVRAYNHWASLLGDKSFPSIEDLEPHNLDDFGPNSVLLDFSSGIDDPAVQFLGQLLAEECGAEGEIAKLSDVPPRSLLSRITDHYLQILANEAPIGFEAEFVNQRGASIMYRGILLPFSSDDETIDFIYGVINWKEIADQVTADELLLEIDQALESDDAVEEEDEPHKHHADPLVDAPSADIFELSAENEMAAEEEVAEEPTNDVEPVAAEYQGPTDEDDIPLPDFGKYTLEDPELGEDDEDGDAGYSFASLSDYLETPAKKAIDLDADNFDPADYDVDNVAAEDAEDAPVAVSSVPNSAGDEGSSADSVDIHAELDEDAGLHDYLASARELAENARATEDRSRQALYAAVGRAYDFSLVAKEAPEEYEELIEESGLSIQDRAPMTPIVKLVFGSDYDKTRLTEYAAVLSHAHRLNLERGALAGFLADADGGLKGVVAAERRIRREEAGKTVEKADEVRKALAQKLRELEELTFDALSADGAEFSVVVVRRDGEGGVSMLGEIEDDIPLIERAARKLVG
ncbi:hypothetical protein [Erythrobacter sp. THAF29]|uniref:PAS domain-containing protein n=1 Tax=Erythrobacter sp. THAF29 TaxID=2587851 RepID=UPI00126798BE|nr:hypothetical protein [Erythrobacter sp. THAF29]QFT76451.1 hypothetical protein FIU90_02730 [Erythrobacter sp. THAF29]